MARTFLHCIKISPQGAFSCALLRPLTVSGGLASASREALKAVSEYGLIEVVNLGSAHISQTYGMWAEPVCFG